MAELETSSYILIVWLAPEQQFEKVVLWPTPKATLGLGRGWVNAAGLFRARGIPELWPLRKQQLLQLTG